MLRLPPIAWMAPVSMPVDVEAEEVDEDDPSDDEDVDEFETEEPEGGLPDAADAQA